jgi:hypothetical protein
MLAAPGPTQTSEDRRGGFYANGITDPFESLKTRDLLSSPAAA